MKPVKGWMRLKICTKAGKGNQKGAAGITAMDENGMVTHAWDVTREACLS